ncbi:MAG: PRC-barrel domain-containing protein [Rubritepida sp.]|nr:PRC-barrel domain-containing protein [Rubritepida sp.]
MLWNASALTGYRIEATDGHLGTVSDLLFDDQSWAIRWLVVDTGHWLPGQKVLLPATALGIPDAGQRQMPVRLARQQVQDAPGVETDLPVSRQMELHLSDHYGAEAYWANGSNAIPLIASPYLMEPRHHYEGEGIVADMGDAQLRSVAAVTGYHLHATDGDIGHVQEFVVDDEGWRITFLAVDTHNWWPGARVLILPRIVREVDWSGSLIHISATRQKVRDSPPYSDAVTVDGTYAEAMSTYYGLSLFAV